MEHNTSSSILAAQSISKLVEKIKNNRNSSDFELKCLKSKCFESDDPVVSLAASRGLVVLAECGILQVASTLSELLSFLSVVKSFTGITTAVFELLRLDLQNKLTADGKYKCPFNLRAPQHPLIVILNYQPSSWMHIYSQIRTLYIYDSDKVMFYANELLYPFYMYVICNPTGGVPELLQHKLWNFIIHTNAQQSVDVAMNAMGWLQLSSKEATLKTSYFLIDFLEVTENDDMKDVLLLWLTSAAYELIRHSHDPRSVFTAINEAVKKRNNLKSIASSIITMLADCVLVCPSNYMCDLLLLCRMIVLLNNSNEFSLETLKAVLLQWMAYGCVLTENILLIANDILLYIENNSKRGSFQTSELFSNKTFGFLKGTNEHVYLAVQLNVLLESSSPSNILDWLNKSKNLSLHVLKRMFNCFAALLLHEFDDHQINIQVINMLLHICKAHQETSTQMVTLLLYKLSNSTDPLILSTLQLLKGGMSNRSFALTLFFELWDTDVNCYRHLHNLLVSPCGKIDASKQWWEWYVTKAHVLKLICIKRPEVHGRELVKPLSDILNQCTGASGALPCALAIEGIKSLCNAGVIDFASTWNELGPRFKSETRTVVIKSLCNLMSEIASFEINECPEKLLEEIITQLWDYAIMSKDSEVVAAAFDALGCFALEQFSTYLPEAIKSTKEVSRFGLVHGNSWLNLLMYIESYALDLAGGFIIKQLSIEIREYHGGVYKVEEGRREPQDYNYLSEFNIVRALGNYIRHKTQDLDDPNKKEVYLQCLRILSQEYSKPLPPVDWCFLQELVHIPETRSYCITLASHQVQLSGTARRLIENYISALTNTMNNEEDRILYKNLKFLSNSIQPVILRPFIEMSLTYAQVSESWESERSENESKKMLFDLMAECLRDALSENNLHEANKLVLSQLVVKLAHKLDSDLPVFKKFLECIVVLPERYITELSSPKLWDEGYPIKQIKLGVKIRCALASSAKAASLKWLNDLIDAACFMPLHCNYFLSSIAEVIESYKNLDAVCTWITELLGHIQSTIANENVSTFHLQFLCDVFILSMVVLAGQDIFVLSSSELITSSVHRLRLFPQSVALLMQCPCWRPHITQLLEWLLHMTNFRNTPKQYKISFWQSLAALKHEKEFEKSNKWMKYIGSAV